MGNIPLDNLLEFDPFSEAEKTTKKDYHDDYETSILGFMLLIKNSEAKRAVLRSIGDTYYGMKFSEFCVIVEQSLFVFEKVFDATYTIKKNQNQNEREVIYADFSRGILIYANSFAEGLNRAKAYMQFEFEQEHANEACSFIQSGHIDKSNVIVTHWDAREGFLYKLQSLDIFPYKRWLSPWKTPTLPWLLNSDEEDGGNYDSKNVAKMKSLPEKVQKMLAATP